MTTAIDTVWGMQPNPAMARQLAVRDIPSLVYDAVNLEGVAMTLPEVQTLLDGITVGGFKISDQNMALNQADAWKHLFSLVSEQRFAFSKRVALDIHNIAGEKAEYAPPPPQTLDKVWSEIETEVNACSDIYDRAITAFLRMARAQFFWDVNKPMGRFMMNGILLAAGFPIINVPAKKQTQFNQLMLGFYHSGDMSAMNKFLRDCLNPRIIENFK